MINRCKFLNIALNTCSEINAPCPCMADPPSCPSYDEDFDRSYIERYSMDKLKGADLIKAERKRLDVKAETTETVTEFADRLDAELDGMGIKVEKSEEIVKDEAPDWF